MDHESRSSRIRYPEKPSHPIKRRSVETFHDWLFVFEAGMGLGMNLLGFASLYPTYNTILSTGRAVVG